ncbi:MAG: hypothetical protein V2A58_12000 [Planctomycetota bacterium]
MPRNEVKALARRLIGICEDLREAQKEARKADGISAKTLATPMTLLKAMLKLLAALEIFLKEPTASDFEKLEVLLKGRGQAPLADHLKERHQTTRRIFKEALKPAGDAAKREADIGWRYKAYIAGMTEAGRKREETHPFASMWSFEVRTGLERLIMILQSIGGLTTAGKRAGRRASYKTPGLTPKQIEACAMLTECNGNYVKAGRRLGRDPKTVRQHVQTAYKKMGEKLPAGKPKKQDHPHDKRGQVLLSGGRDSRAKRKPYDRRDSSV